MGRVDEALLLRREKAVLDFQDAPAGIFYVDPDAAVRAAEHDGRISSRMGDADCVRTVGQVGCPVGAVAYFLRSYVSTAIGQFADNMIFALVVSHVFFGWSIVQCVTCAVTGMVAELLCEVAFSGIGYAVCKKWKKEQVGKAYFDFSERLKEKTK